MVLFWADPVAPGGWSRLERSMTLAVHAVPRSALLVAIPSHRRAEKYLAGRRITAVGHERALREMPDGIDLVVMDQKQPNEAAERIIKMGRERSIPVFPIRDPGDPDWGAVAGCLGGWPPDGNSSSPPGPEWAILHPRFRHFNQVRRVYPRRARKVLLHLEERLGYRELGDLIDPLWRRGYRVRVGPMASIRGNLKRALSAKYPGLRWVGAVECMARPLFEADAALLIPGAAALEAAAVGTPALYLCPEEKERRTAAQLERLGIGLVAESPEDVLSRLDRDTLRGRGTAGKLLIDGRGLFRTLDFLRLQGFLHQRRNGTES